MIDINLIREKPEEVRAAMRALNDKEALSQIDRVLDLDQQRRSLLVQVEEMRAEKNKVSKIIGQTRNDTERQSKINQMKALNAHLEKAEQELAAIEPQLEELMLFIPNMPAPEVPVGPDESHNTIIGEWGDKPVFDFEPKAHWDLGPALGIIDFERGTKLSGSRFYVLMGAGARLQRALIAWMIDVHVNEHGYTEVYPPYMVRGEILVGTGNLPKFGEHLYRDIEEDFWWIPTAEVPVTNLHRDEILEADELPLKYVAYTPCFRREKMSAGRDVRGIKRGHQFDKVEMVRIVPGDPAISALHHRELLHDGEEICQKLGLPYRLVQMCTGDLSFTAANKIDIEIWAAGCGEWLEVSSCSNFHDFQARRAKLRYRPEPGAKAQYVHTLNASGLALPRVMIGIIENYQQADGSIIVPEVLRPYMGGVDRISGR